MPMQRPYSQDGNSFLNVYTEQVFLTMDAQLLVIGSEKCDRAFSNVDRSRSCRKYKPRRLSGRLD